MNACLRAAATCSLKWGLAGACLSHLPAQAAIESCNLFELYTPSGHQGLLVSMQASDNWRGTGPARFNTKNSKVAFYVPNLTNPSHPEGVAHRQMVIFDFDTLAQDVQKAMAISEPEILEQVKILLRLMGGIYLDNLTADAKARLESFSIHYQTLFDERPSYHELKLIEIPPVLPASSIRNEGLANQMFLAVHYQLAIEYGHKLLEWQKAATRVQNRDTENAHRVVSFALAMKDRGYDAAQTWWALRTVIAGS